MLKVWFFVLKIESNREKQKIILVFFIGEISHFFRILLENFQITKITLIAFSFIETGETGFLRKRLN